MILQECLLTTDTRVTVLVGEMDFVDRLEPEILRQLHQALLVSTPLAAGQRREPSCLTGRRTVTNMFIDVVSISCRYFNYSLETILREVRKGKRTLVTIQFGQNDHILPPESMGANLTSMVQNIQAIGGEPVLITPLTQRIFYKNGAIEDSLGPWVAGLYFCLSTDHLIFI